MRSLQVAGMSIEVPKGRFPETHVSAVSPKPPSTFQTVDPPRPIAGPSSPSPSRPTSGSSSSHQSEAHSNGWVSVNHDSFKAPSSAVDEFSHSYPSIDEFDASGSWVLPSVPNGDPGSPPRLDNSRPPKVLNEAGLNLLDQPSIPPSPSAPNINRFARPASSPAISASFNELLSHPPNGSEETRRPVPSTSSQVPRPESPTTSSVSPKHLMDWISAGRSVLVLDIRTRDEFEKEHPKLEKIACIEPTVLLRAEYVFINFVRLTFF